MMAAGIDLDGATQLALPRERAVALVCNGSGVAVLMASPGDLDDLYTGFLLTEGIVANAGDIAQVEVIEHGHGIEVRGRIPEARAEALNARRRAAVGPVGCGLCGIDSLHAATEVPARVGAAPPVAALRQVIDANQAAFADGQVLRRAQGAMHAAAYFETSGLIALREDVGRHNALDKVVGAVAARDLAQGALFVTSRVSIDLVQKCARIGLGALFSVSSPTRDAVELATRCGVMIASQRGAAGWIVHCDPNLTARQEDAP